MAETLGMLCDKITIVKLKEFHTNDESKLLSLKEQSIQLQEEIDEYISSAISGEIEFSRLKFESNKVYNDANNVMRVFEGKIGNLIVSLASINCYLWHEQEKVFEFHLVPVEEKDEVIKKLAVLNLERNQCIDKINSELYNIVIDENS